MSRPSELIVVLSIGAPETLPGRDVEGPRAIGVVIRISEAKGKTTTDVRYYVYSLRLEVKRFAKAVRGY